VIIINYCAECNSPTNSIYYDYSIGFLCGKCVKEHGEYKIEELNKDKDKINKQIQEIKEQITIAIQSDCKHENSYGLCYGYYNYDKHKFIEKYECPNCKLLFYKEC